VPPLGVVPASLVTYRRIVEQYGRAAGADVAYAALAERYDDLDRHELEAQTWEAMARQFPANTRDAAWEAAELYDKRLKDKARAAEWYAMVPSTSRHYRDAQKRLGEK
jgi:hypothetical protein